MKREQSFERLSVMYANIGKLITASVEFQDILEGIMAEVQNFFKPKDWSMLRYDAVTDKLYFAIIQGEDLEKYRNFRLDLGEGIAGYVAKHKKALLVHDAYSDPRFNKDIDKETGFHTNCIIAVPCMTRDKLYGVFELVNHDGMDQFTEADLSILQSIADFAAIAFANAETYQLALFQSRIDPLTGLWNQSKLRETIEQYERYALHRRREDNGCSIIVVFIDLNDFKMINDNYGHSEGDDVLIRISTMLGSAFRKDDMLFRNGGDEFIAILESDSQQCVDLTETINGRLKEVLFTHSRHDYSVGISFGLAYGEPENIRSLINEADKAMYGMKNGADKN